MDLEGDWEVGLVEIQYPHTWYNLRSDEGELTVWSTTPFREHSFQIPASYYPSVETLLERIETGVILTLNVTRKPAKLGFDPITRKVTTDITSVSLQIGE